MKKWTPVFLSLMLSTTASAYHKPFTGFYGGLDLGLVQSIVPDDYNTVLTWPQAFEIAIASKAKLTDTSAVGGVTLGYSTLLQNRWVLGLEGRAHFQNLDTKNHEEIREVNSMLQIQRNTSVGIDQDFALVAKLGFASHCKFLMYGLIGADWAKVNLSTDTRYQQNLESLIVGTLENASSKYEDGLILGLGVEYLITKCSSIGLEYNYIDYDMLNFKNPITGDLLLDGVPQVGAFITDNNSMKMHTNKVFLKFNYYFA